MEESESSYTGNPANPCTPITGNTYPAGDVELTLIDAWSVDVMRVKCVDTIDNVIFLSVRPGAVGLWRVLTLTTIT